MHIHTHIYLYTCIFQKTLISAAFSQISACGLSGQKMKPQAESDFIHILKYSDKILWTIQVKRNALWVMFAVF